MVKVWWGTCAEGGGTGVTGFDGVDIGTQKEGSLEGGAMGEGSGGMSVSVSLSMSMESHRQRVGLPSGTGEPARGAGRSGVA